MPVNLPSADEVREIAARCGFHLSADEIEAYRGLMPTYIASYNFVDGLSEAAFTPKYPRTRSRDSPTALSGRPTTAKAGMPAPICTCTSTGSASMPWNATVVTWATMNAPREARGGIMGPEIGSRRGVGLALRYTNRR